MRLIDDKQRDADILKRMEELALPQPFGGNVDEFVAPGGEVPQAAEKTVDKVAPAKPQPVKSAALPAKAEPAAKIKAEAPAKVSAKTTAVVAKAEPKVRAEVKAKTDAKASTAATTTSKPKDSKARQ